MDLTGEYVLPAPRARVWTALNDPEVLKRCIPGCQEIQKLSDTEMTAKVALAVGPVRATFSGRVTLSDLDPPNGYRISGEGQGGVAGFGKGSATVRLADEGAGTKLSYVADASVGGKLAQIGSRLVEATAKKLADQFFDRFAAEFPAGAAVEPPASASSPGPTPGASAAAPLAAVAQGGVGRRLSPTIWVPALIALVAIVLWIATRG
jgi:carbon monoxide dehydrogenase subunit G